MLNILSYKLSIIVFIALSPGIAKHTNHGQQLRAVHLSGLAQGTTWNTSYYAADSVVSQKELDSILLVIDSSLSIYKPYSTITAFNNSKSGTRIDDHFRAVVKKSLLISQQTHNLSDITVGPLVSAWGFGPKRGNGVPSDSLIASLLPCVGPGKLQLSNDSLIKFNSCTKIDVNGIAQGYSVDVLADFLEKRGIKDYLAELGGEVRVKGKKYPGRTPFTLGIESPAVDDFSTPPMQKIITVHKGAITTSGNYRKFYESNGTIISHIINPITGKPVNNELISVTVYAQDAITADAYDNALMLMGLTDAMKFVEKHPEIGAFFIYKKENGSIADTASSRFKKLFLTKIKTQK